MSRFYYSVHQLLYLLRIARTTPQILQIHAQLITTTLISDPFAAGQLLASLMLSVSDITYAGHMFTRIAQPNTFMWNTMVRGYVSISNPEMALHFYAKMRRNGLLGDGYTYPFVLKACGMLGGCWEGREIHGEVVKAGLVGDVFVRNGLIGLYCKEEEMGCARRLFDGFPGRNLVSWNLMLGGYVGSGDAREAKKVFDEMPDRDVVSYSIMIDGYGKKFGDIIRARVLFDSMPIKDLISWNSMIDSYAKAGDMVAAQQLFTEMEEKNVISWSIMIDGYAQHGNPKEALILFRQMLCQGIKPDKVSIVGALLACAQLGALDQGRWIHMHMKKKKIMLDIVVQTALVDMYMKCGSVNEASSIFNGMAERNIVTWNVMIAGLGLNGFPEAALECFSQMEMERIQMDDLIFLSVLASCSHAGLVTEGLAIFDRMRIHGIRPKLEHYGCLIDLLGRAGQLNLAQMVINSVPVKHNAALWGSLLLACRTHKSVALAELVLEKLVELLADDSGAYVLMSNIYAEAGIWEGVSKIRKLMRDRNLKKETGRSLIEVDGSLVEFVSGEKSHIQRVEVDRVIWSLMKMVMPSVGYEKRGLSWLHTCVL